MTRSFLCGVALLLLLAVPSLRASDEGVKSDSNSAWDGSIAGPDAKDAVAARSGDKKAPAASAPAARPAKNGSVPRPNANACGADGSSRGEGLVEAAGFVVSMAVITAAIFTLGVPAAYLVCGAAAGAGAALLSRKEGASWKEALLWAGLAAAAGPLGLGITLNNFAVTFVGPAIDRWLKGRKK